MAGNMIEISRNRAELNAALIESLEIFTLFQEESFDELMAKALMPVAKTMDVNRIVVYEHVIADEVSRFRQIYRWDSLKGGLTRTSLDLLPDIRVVKEWLELVKQNICIGKHISVMEDYEVEYMEVFGIKSILLAPIYTHNELWGCVIFQDHNNERDFDQDCEDLYRAAARLFVDAIIRENMTQRSSRAVVEIEHREKMLETLFETAITFLSQGEESFEDMMTTGINRIVEMVHLDRMSVWRNFRMPDGLHMSQVYRWDRESGGTTRPIDILKDLSYTQLVPSWEELFRKGISINSPVSKIAEPEGVKIMQSMGVVSAFFTPVFNNNEFWGFVLFEDRCNERYFDEASADMMRSAAFLCANTVIRTEMEREIAETHQRIQLMLNAAPLCCHLFDEDCNLLDCNQEALNLFKVPDKQKHLENFYSMMPERQPDGVESVNEVRKRLKDTFITGRSFFEWVHRNTIGELIPSEVTLVRVKYGEGNIVLAYVHDLREAKAREQQMLESAERERMAVLQKEAAQDASEAKGRFLAHMSHEIRTPMNAVLGMSELLLQEKLSESQFRYARDIKTATTTLLQIINDILDMSKIESGSLGLEEIPFDLHELLTACKSIIMTRAVEKNIELQFITDPYIPGKLSGDPTRLRQVLLNLLSNAVKFSKADTVSIKTELESKTDKAVALRFSIVDRGIGMTQEQVSKVFEPFMQADVSTTREYGGTGLGLPITKNILELMGSRLEIESTPGEGTTVSFAVTLSIAYGADELIGSDELSASPEKPMFDALVLVCEDNKMNQQVITEHLTRIGITVDIAENGLQGVEKVRERADDGGRPYDLILMDIHMPVMDGIEATRSIIGSGAAIPIVAMTANIMAEDRELYTTLGMDDCVGKPFTARELWKCLYKYLKPVNSVKQETGVDDDELLIMLKKEFVKSNQSKFDEIVTAIIEGDIKLAHRLAHSLKSNAGLIGKTGLQKAAADVEDALKSGVDLSTKSQLDTLNKELTIALDDLKPFYAAAGSSASADTSEKEYDAKTVRDLFDRLEPLLERGSPDSLDLVDDLYGLPGSEELIGFIEELCFSDALKSLDKLKQELGVG